MKTNSTALIEATANAIMENFIPKEENKTEFSFCFTIPPSANYKVNYQKDNKGIWQILSLAPDNK